MMAQGAEVTSFGVGERLITSSSSPVLGGVYKLVAVKKDGVDVPKIKLSENVQKITTPATRGFTVFMTTKPEKPPLTLSLLQTRLLITPSPMNFSIPTLHGSAK